MPDTTAHTDCIERGTTPCHGTVEPRMSLSGSDSKVRASHDHVTAVLRAHRHLAVAPRRLRDWYQSAALTRLPEAADPG